MLKHKGNYMTFQDGAGSSCKVVDRRITEVRQGIIHFREETVGERRFWDAQVAGTVVERAVSVPYESKVDRGDIFLIEDQQYEVAQKDRKDTMPVSWLLSLKKPVVNYKDARVQE